MNKISKSSISIFVTILLTFGIVKAVGIDYTATTGELLTAQKWNDLVAKVDGIFTSAGKVGIGTDAPFSKLEVIQSSDGTNGYVANFIHQSTVGGYGLRVETLNESPYRSILDLVSNGVNKVRVTSTGDMGIGTTTPSAKLQVVGGITSLEQEAWHSVTFQNSWGDHLWAPVGYYKDSLGIVHLRGLVDNGVIGSCVFTLPVGYRPAYSRLFNVISLNAIGRLDIYSDGCVKPVYGNNSWISLDGVSFRLD